MPIECTEKIRAATREEFYQIDQRLLGVAYDVQNQFGRFLNERLYQNEISERCTDLFGLELVQEMEIRVSFRDFVKEYFVDLLVNQSVPIETKTVEKLTQAHEAQL